MSGVVGVEVSGATTVVTAGVEIDISNVGQLQRALDDATAERAGLVVVDLSRTVFIDSAALAALLRAHHALHQGGRALRLVEGGPDVMRVFFVTGTAERLSIFGSVDEALAGPP